MIDETLLEDAFADLAATIPVPADGPDRLLDALATRSEPQHPNRSRFTKPLLVAAAAVVVVGVAVAALHGATGSARVSSAKRAFMPATTAGPAERSFGNSQTLAPYVPPANGGATNNVNVPGSGSAPTPTPPSRSQATSTGPVDAAKIVKTGTLDLQVPHGTLRLTVNRVTAATVGLGGYVAQSKTNYGGSDPSAEVTIRVPVDQFDTAITRLDALPGVKVMGESENGVDVTGQYTDLQAQLKAATAARDAFLAVLAQARNVGDILAVNDRLSAAQTVVDQLQGRINVLDGQATFSSLAVTVSEQPVAAKAAVHPAQPPTGLAKSWSDARSGFADAVEWLIARSGAALIVLLAALALLFGIRYLYPVVRRGLV